MMDRELIVLTNTQLGFIDFIVAPLLTGKLSQVVVCLALHVEMRV